MNDRRVMARSNLEAQIANEDALVSRLTITRLTIDTIETLARSTKPTNDSMYMFNVDVLL